MMILLDTNILLRLLNINHADHLVVRRAVEKLRLANNQLVIVPQVLYEYWVVATRPIQVNGFGLSPADADADTNLDRAIVLFTLLLDESGIFSNWKSMVTNFAVAGKNGHDARLVAAMICHGVTNILTFNSADFTRFPMIKAQSPSSVVAT